MSLRPGLEDDALEVRRAVTLVRNDATNSYTIWIPSEERSCGDLFYGVEPENVRLSFNNVWIPTCTCGYGGWCSHRIAVVFHLYSQAHSLTDWLHEWRRTETQQMALSISERTPDAWIDVLTRLTQSTPHD